MNKTKLYKSKWNTEQKRLNLMNSDVTFLVVSGERKIKIKDL